MWQNSIDNSRIKAISHIVSVDVLIPLSIPEIGTFFFQVSLLLRNQDNISDMATIPSYQRIQYPVQEICASYAQFQRTGNHDVSFFLNIYSLNSRSRNFHWIYVISGNRRLHRQSKRAKLQAGVGTWEQRRYSSRTNRHQGELCSYGLLYVFFWFWCFIDARAFYCWWILETD